MADHIVASSRGKKSKNPGARSAAYGPAESVTRSQRLDLLSLDDSSVQNWVAGTMAVRHPDASLHTQLAWLWGNVAETKALLWGYLSMPTPAREYAYEMADALCSHIETKLLVMQQLLENLCEQTAEVQRARP